MLPAIAALFGLGTQEGESGILVPSDYEENTSDIVSDKGAILPWGSVVQELPTDKLTGEEESVRDIVKSGLSSYNSSVFRKPDISKLSDREDTPIIYGLSPEEEGTIRAQNLGYYGFMPEETAWVRDKGDVGSLVHESTHVAQDPYNTKEYQDLDKPYYDRGSE